MSLELNNTISSLLKASTHFNVSDLLVHTDLEKGNSVKLSALTAVPKEHVPTKIIRDAATTLRESGINSLCAVTNFISLELGTKNVTTPLLLFPVDYQLDKIHGCYSFTLDAEGAFLNPFLMRHLSVNLSMEIPTNLIDSTDANQWNSFFNVHGLKTIETSPVLGNFHHHRFSVIKELEELLETEKSSALQEVLGEGKQPSKPVSLSPFQLFPSDTDHVRVFATASISNTVIQGPPGTGKSQVLTNIVAKAIGENASVLVVSEKIAALEVIQKKLGTFGLDRLTSISTSRKDTKAFLTDLKSCWSFFESLKPVAIAQIQTSQHYEDNLQMTMDLLGQPDLVGGITFSAFQQLRVASATTTTYVSTVPELDVYLDECVHIRTIFEQGLGTIVGKCKPLLFQGDQLVKFDTKVRFWIEELKTLSESISELTWGKIAETMQLSSQLQIFENDLFRAYERILRPDSREQKRYLKLVKSYTKLLLKKSQHNHSHWKIEPSETEVNSLLTAAKTGNYLHRRKLKKRWRQLSEVPFEHLVTSLEELQQELAIEKEITQILIQFCDLGITEPDVQLPLITQTLPHFTLGHWEAYASVSPEQRAQLTQSHAVLNTLYRDLRTYFSFRDDDALLPYLETLLVKLPTLLQYHEVLKKWDGAFYVVFQHASDYDTYVAIVVHSHAVKFQERFPQLANEQANELTEKIERVIESENVEAKAFATSLLQSTREAFHAAHTLLNTPARSLTPAEKSRKMRLKKGKSILVKEFSKSRQHLTLRQLFQSEAREWIQLLKPIWLSNPAQLADCFPMEKSMFDLVIFDEASQLPLQNALGALQRCSRAIIAGDEHQMGPTSYFVAGESQTVNLLHQATFHFPKIALKHHYRSVHPDLIAFSNHHFYEDKLQVFPHFQHQGSCLTHHYISEGRFENRINLEEAKQVASAMEIELAKGRNLGIVAFSEEQLACIWNQLSAASQERLSDALSNNSAFFKAVENVQGDECDYLLISFGYGKNEKGEFHHRFGPMNTENGRKRLNVLLTRARVHIDFFCSIRSEEFKLSENESINLIRQWVRFSESYSPELRLAFPFGLQPKVLAAQLEFTDVYTELCEAKELVTMHRVLNERGWTCVYGK